jgi:hypothetical protein
MSHKRKYQISLLGLSGTVAVCAVVVRFCTTRYAEDLWPVVPACAVCLLIASFSAKMTAWRYVWRSLSAITAIVALGFVHLASGYSASFLGIWTVPGPPGPIGNAVFWALGITFSLLGLVSAVMGIVRGKLHQQAIALASGVILLGTLAHSVRLFLNV